MRDRLIELTKKAFEQCKGKKCEECAGYGKGADCIHYVVTDHLLANGVIVPPRKVGDTVYYINIYNHIMLYRDRVYEASVSRIVVTKCGVSFVIRVHGGHVVNEIPGVEFGKNVFLTREEAERVLKGDRDNA